MRAFLSQSLRLFPSLGVMALLTAVACSDDGSSSAPNEMGDGDGDGDQAGDGDGDGDGDGANWEYSPAGPPCEFGDDEDKCGGQDNVACTPVLGETGTSCDDDDDCGSRELCFASNDPDASAGICLRLYGECLDRCGTDGDCGDGQACEVATGQCVENPDNEGERFGETCESDDDCAGTCVQVSDEVSECEEQCRVGASSGCGWDALDSSDVSCAYFAYDLSDFGEEQGAGDLGICAHLCDCTSECPGDQKCLPDPRRGFAGVCTGGEVPEEVTECPSGMGGAGGS